MLALRRVRQLFLRWNQLLILALYSIPILLIAGLGFLWLYQNTLLLHFFVLCLLLSIVALGIRGLTKKTQAESNSDKNSLADPELVEVEPNPEWADKERRAFYKTCAFIQASTPSLLPWQDLPPLALELIQKVATEIGGDRKKPLDFSTPEALLLIEQTAARYREHLRSKMPFADQVSIGTLYWFWKKRKNLTTAWKLADGGRRLARFASNPAGAVIKEVEQLVTGGNANYLSDQMMMTLQIIFLEEVASVAIDLYSGRLKFSDAELQNIELASTQQDKDRAAQPDEPLRVLVVGQVSSGKSSLLNNLLACDAAETDAAATTDTVTNYEVELDETPCHFLDSPGIDGTQENLEMILSEICDSDIVIWVLRADRPSRAADLALMESLRKWDEAHPLRRQPVLIFVASFIDKLANDWPQPEHQLSEQTQNVFSHVSQAISADMKVENLIPLSNASPVWNVDSLIARISLQRAEALMVQRNRRRLTAHKRSSSIVRGTGKGLGGVYKSVKFLGGRWYKNKRRPPGNEKD